MIHKEIYLYGGTTLKHYWSLTQPISRDGRIINVGRFRFIEKSDWKKYKRGKYIALYGHTEEGIRFQIKQYIKSNGEIGTYQIWSFDAANRYLGTTNKFYSELNKRERPKYCELCNSVSARLEYHHWNPTDVNIGIWLCPRCHKFVGYVEQLFSLNIKFPINKYLNLKKMALLEINKRKNHIPISEENGKIYPSKE